MNRKYSIALLLAVPVLAGILFYRTTLREREVVILSTNDMHANISNFARLAEAVGQCRDTVATVLVDAGDRWTGNAFVDLADGRRPIYDLMNELGYDAATLGNHEFDLGTAFLRDAVEYADFDIVCANVKNVSADFMDMQPSVTIKTGNGVDIRFVGVVTNYDNGHPDGNDEIFEGLEFPDPMKAACRAAEASDDGDVLVLLSHMARDKDFEFAERCDRYDVIIGGHSHDVVDTLVNRTVIGQTGNKLRMVGATRIRLKGNRIKSIDYENIPLDRYAEDNGFAERVAEIESNPELRKNVGTLGVALDKTGLADMETALIARAMGADIGFYHYGGIRLAELPAGGVSMSTLFDLEPFFSEIYTMTMTPEQMRNMIIAKYNDTGNAKESHRIDLFSSTPYTIVLDDRGEAVGVRFPDLQEGVAYKVAMADYIAKKYVYEASDVERHSVKVLDVIAEHFREHSPVVFSNAPKQKTERK